MEQITPWYQQFNFNGKFTTKVGFMNKDYFNQILPLFPNSLKGVEILDLCCNAGFVTYELSQLGAKVIGVEVNPNYLSQAYEAGMFYPTSTAEFLLEDVEKLDFSMYKSDIILALSCLYHLNDPLNFIKRISNQDSLIIASFRANLFDQFASYFKLFGRNVENVTSYGKKLAARFV